MKLFLPDNIYARLLAKNLPEPIREKTTFLPSSSIPNELRKNNSSAGLITPADLLTSPDIFISSKVGISFEGVLSNSYIYFQPDQQEFSSLSLAGDVSTLEVILSKIFFRENYNSEIQVEILSDVSKGKNKNLMVVGDINFINLDFTKGISFSEQIVDMLSLPYVNFILAAFDKRVIEDLNMSVTGISKKIYDNVEQGIFGKGLNNRSKEYIKENIGSLIYEFENQDLDDIYQLLHLPYFYGIVQNIVEPKFV